MPSSTDPKRLLTILGITGNQGSSVAKLFLTDASLSASWTLRGITRNPSKPSNKHLIDAGVELISADLDDPSSLKAAFKGSDAIFAVTDFWQFVQPGHPTFEEAEQRGVSPNVVAMQKEVVQGKNIVDAAAAVHAEKPLHRLVVSTLSDSEKWTGGEITHNLHFDGKAHYCEYLKHTYPALASATSYVQVGYYLSNSFAYPFWMPRGDPNNPGEYIVPHSGEATKPVPFVNPPHDMGYFVEALINRAPPGTDMVAYCNLMTFEEFTALWGRQLRVKARCERMSKEKLVENGLPEWLALEVTQSAEYMSKWGWAGGDPNVRSPEECGVDMSKLTDIAQWIPQQDWKL